jgi:hypothetical protein
MSAPAVTQEVALVELQALAGNRPVILVVETCGGEVRDALSWDAHPLVAVRRTTLRGWGPMDGPAVALEDGCIVPLSEWQRVAAAYRCAQRLNDDGSNFETEGGRGLEELAESMGARVEYGRRVLDVTTEEETAAPCARAEWREGDPIRHVFPDGSAIVDRGDAWDVEGATPFSWEGGAA